MHKLSEKGRMFEELLVTKNCEKRRKKKKCSFRI